MQVRIYPGLVAKPSKLAGFAGALQRTGQHLGEFARAKSVAQARRLPSTVFGKWHVGVTRMPARGRPFGFSVTDEKYLRDHAVISGSQAPRVAGSSARK